MKKILITMITIGFSAGTLATTYEIKTEALSKSSPSTERSTTSQKNHKDPIVNTKTHRQHEEEQERQEASEYFEDNGNGTTTNPRINP